MLNLTPVRRLADFHVTYYADVEAFAYLYASIPYLCKGDITFLTALSIGKQIHT